mgnify:CR=1 FL=1
MDRHHQEDISLHRITSLALLDDYAMKLTFDDGTEQTVDLEPILSGPIFGPLREKVLFQEVVIDPNFGALVWPNGADIDPMVLYDWPAYVERIIARRAEMISR